MKSSLTKLIAILMTLALATTQAQGLREFLAPLAAHPGLAASLAQLRL